MHKSFVEPENTNVKTVEFVSELTKFAMVLLTVLTKKRMNGHVVGVANALDHQKFVTASKIVMIMRMKRNVASTVS